MDYEIFTLLEIPAVIARLEKIKMIVTLESQWSVIAASYSSIKCSL